MKRPRGFLLKAAVLLATLPSTGCLERTLTIETSPPGARVIVDRLEVGLTPVTVPFTYSGTREFLILHEDGDVKFKPIYVLQDVGNDFYDVLPFDFLVEIQPATVRDEHVFRFDLEPSTHAASASVDRDAYVAALRKRAEELRVRARELQETGPLEAPPLLERRVDNGNGGADLPVDSAPAAPESRPAGDASRP